MEEDNSNLIFDLDNDPITIMYKNMISKQIKQPLEWCLFSEKYKAITQVYNNQQCIEILVHKIGGTIIFAISNRFTFGHVQEMNGYPNMLSMYVYGTRWRQRSIFPIYLIQKIPSEMIQKIVTFCLKYLDLRKVIVVKQLQ